MQLSDVSLPDEEAIVLDITTIIRNRGCLAFLRRPAIAYAIVRLAGNLVHY